jgi:hypothetical protein
VRRSAVTDDGNWLTTDPLRAPFSFLWREVRGNQMAAAGHGEEA